MNFSLLCAVLLLALKIETSGGLYKTMRGASHLSRPADTTGGLRCYVCDPCDPRQENWVERGGCTGGCIKTSGTVGGTDYVSRQCHNWLPSIGESGCDQDISKTVNASLRSCMCNERDLCNDAGALPPLTAPLLVGALAGRAIILNFY